MKPGPLQHIAPDVELGRDVHIGDFVNLYGCRIGEETRVGPFVEIQKDTVIGRRCKISSHAFICSGVIIGDEVFIGHHVVFVNDRYPHATREDGALQTETDWPCEPVKVEPRASIGSGAVILGNVTIGAGALVGAGSVVTHDVPPGAVVAGNPARPLPFSVPEVPV
jgi:UDP-2-acetamido-3-amino-2,3-dideoxy-glucuronate N-acetyltransferase